MKKGLIAAVIIMVILAGIATAGCAYLFTKPKDNGHELIVTDSIDRFVFPENYTVNETIMDSLVLSGDYLVQHIKSNGKWEYQYLPETDSLASKYNILRHAGTTYSLALIFSFTKDLRYYNGTITTLNYLANERIVYENTPTHEIGYITYPGDYIKLGGAALALLAFIQTAKIDPEVDYDREINALGNFLLMMQYDNGKMQCFYKEKEDEHNDFYPGESLIALAKLHDYTGEQKYLDALTLGLGFYNDYYKAARYTAYTPWGTEAMLFAHMWTGNDSYLDFSYKMAASCLSGQNQPHNTDDPRHVGGWGSNPGSNGASRVEGAVDSYLMAKRDGDIDQVKKLEGGVFLCGQFLMNLQYNETDVQDFANPGRALGGYPFNHEDDTVRIDAVQHSVVVLAKIMLYQSTTQNL